MHETKPYFTAQFHPEASSVQLIQRTFSTNFLRFAGQNKAALNFNRETQSQLAGDTVSKVLLLGR